MGQKSSVVKVTAKVTVPSGCDTLDTIRVSYKKRWCCGTKRRVVASFTFPRKNWHQLFPEDLLRNKSAEVAKVHIGKLMKKDGNTPVKVNCLAGGVSVFNTEMTLAYFRTRLQHTKVGGEVLLCFSLKDEGCKAAEQWDKPLQPCSAMGNGLVMVAPNPPEPPQQHKTDNTSEPDDGLLEEAEAEKKAREWQEFVANTYTDVWEEEISPEMDPPQGTPAHPDPLGGELEEEEIPIEGEYSPEAKKKAKEWEEFVANTYSDVWDDEISPEMDAPHPRGEDPARGSLWHLVADCAGVVAFVLMVYYAWVEYDKL